MFLSIHAAIGATIGEHSGNPVVGFLLGFISHFLGDLVPHGDRKLDHWIGNGKKWKRLLLLLGLDAIALVSFVWIIFDSAPIHHPRAVWAGIIGGILPDFLWIPYNVLKKDILKQYALWHNKMHDTIRHDIKLWQGIAMQGAILFVIYNILF